MFFVFYILFIILIILLNFINLFVIGFDFISFLKNKGILVLVSILLVLFLE